MIGRAFYTFLFFILLPVSALLIFKPEAWQSFYTRLYSSKFESRGNPLLKTLTKSLLAMISTEAGWLAHRALGILLALITVYILLKKLKIFSSF